MSNASYRRSGSAQFSRSRTAVVARGTHMASQSISRRNFMQQSAAWAAAFAAGSSATIGTAHAARETELNILCWEGYNSAQVLDPFRAMKSATVKAESLTNDPTMINRLRAGETN